MSQPPQWTKEEFERDRLQAVEVFREILLREPLEEYLDLFDRNQGIFEDQVETTVDLTDLRANGRIF